MPQNVDRYYCCFAFSFFLIRIAAVPPITVPIIVKGSGTAVLDPPCTKNAPELLKSSTSWTRNSSTVPSVIPEVKPSEARETLVSERLVGGLELDAPFAEVAENRRLKPKVLLPRSRNPSPIAFPVVRPKEAGPTTIPAAFVFKPGVKLFASSTRPETFKLIVSVSKKLPLTVKDGPEKTSVPLTVIPGTVSDAAFALVVLSAVTSDTNPAVTNEALKSTFRYAECGFLLLVEDMVNNLEENWGRSSDGNSVNVLLMTTNRFTRTFC
jgi:hypothetical protein